MKQGYHYWLEAIKGIVRKYYEQLHAHEFSVEGKD